MESVTSISALPLPIPKGVATEQAGLGLGPLAGLERTYHVPQEARASQVTLPHPHARIVGSLYPPNPKVLRSPAEDGLIPFIIYIPLLLFSTVFCDKICHFTK